MLFEILQKLYLDQGQLMLDTFHSAANLHQ